MSSSDLPTGIEVDEPVEVEHPGSQNRNLACVYCGLNLSLVKLKDRVSTEAGSAHRVCVSCCLCDRTFFNTDWPCKQVKSKPFCPQCEPVARLHETFTKLQASVQNLNKETPRTLVSFATTVPLYSPRSQLNSPNALAARTRRETTFQLIRLFTRLQAEVKALQRRAGALSDTISQKLQELYALEKNEASVPPSSSSAAYSDFVQTFPNEISKYVFTMLDPASLGRCLQVSKAWQRLASDDRFVWKTLYENLFGPGIPLESTYYSSFRTCWLEVGHILHADRIVYHARFELRLPDLNVRLTARPKRPCRTAKRTLPRGFSAHPLDSAEVCPGLLSIENFDAIVDFYSFLEENMTNCPLSEIIRQEKIADAVLYRYYRFMLLKAKYPHVLMIPTDDIVRAWLTHLSRPQLYAEDCQKCFGGQVLDYGIIPPYGLFPQLSKVVDGMEKLWKQEYQCSYFFQTEKHPLKDIVLKQREPDAEDREGRINDPADAIFNNINCFFTLGRLEMSSESDEAEYSAFLLGQYDPNWKCPLQITALQVIHDCHLAACIEPVRSYSYDVGFVIEDPQFAAISAKMYEKFLFLQALHPEAILETSSAVDFAMRAHMAYPLRYAADCKRLFGRVLPRDSESGKAALRRYEETRLLWKEEYGVDMQADPFLSPLMESNASKHQEVLADFNERVPRTYQASVFGVTIRYPTIQAAIAANVCTLEATGLAYQYQDVFHCHTCEMDENEAACVVCAQRCHAGHDLESWPGADFYCDCGLSNSCHARK